MNAVSPGRNGLWINTAPARQADASLTITGLGWALSVSLFGREILVGWNWREDVYLYVEEDGDQSP